MIDNDLYAYVLRLLDYFSPQQLADVEEHVRAKRDAQTGVSAIANHARDRNANRICPRCGFSGVHRFGRVGVSRDTLFRWRTVILQALSDPSSKPLEGVIETDETYFEESFKGSRGGK